LSKLLAFVVLSFFKLISFPYISYLNAEYKLSKCRWWLQLWFTCCVNWNETKKSKSYLVPHKKKSDFRIILTFSLPISNKFVALSLLLWIEFIFWGMLTSFPSSHAIQHTHLSTQIMPFFLTYNASFTICKFALYTWIMSLFQEIYLPRECLFFLTYNASFTICKFALYTWIMSLFQESSTIIRKKESNIVVISISWICMSMRFAEPKPKDGKYSRN
jgi:hypothetical protein